MSNELKDVLYKYNTHLLQYENRAKYLAVVMKEIMPYHKMLLRTLGVHRERQDEFARLHHSFGESITDLAETVNFVVEDTIEICEFVLDFIGELEALKKRLK